MFKISLLKIISKIISIETYFLILKVNFVHHFISNIFYTLKEHFDNDLHDIDAYAYNVRVYIYKILTAKLTMRPLVMKTLSYQRTL